MIVSVIDWRFISFLSPQYLWLNVRPVSISLERRFCLFVLCEVVSATMAVIRLLSRSAMGENNKHYCCYSVFEEWRTTHTLRFTMTILHEAAARSV